MRARLQVSSCTGCFVAPWLTHRQTDSFWPVIPLAQPSELIMITRNGQYARVVIDAWSKYVMTLDIRSLLWSSNLVTQSPGYWLQYDCVLYMRHSKAAKPPTPVYVSEYVSICCFLIAWRQTVGHCELSSRGRNIIRVVRILRQKITNSANVTCKFCALFLAIFTALHGMQTQFSDEKAVCLSVRPSVCPSNAWIVTKRKKDLSRILHHTKDHLA